MPAAFGIERAERVGSDVLYQHVAVPILGGLAHIEQQAFVRFRRVSDTPARVETCWEVISPLDARSGMREAGVPFTTAGMGMWALQADEGGTFVQYQFWAAADLAPPRVAGWLMSRTLPDLLAAFEARARSFTDQPQRHELP